MLNIKHYTDSDYRTEPWKNGKGETSVIAMDEHSPFLWRLSRALLKEDGPFSDYTSYQRLFVLLKGGPVDIQHAEKKGRVLSEMTPYTFDGSWKTEARLKSMAVDFNVLLLQEKCRGSLYPTFLKRNAEMQFPISGTEHFIYCVEGQIEVLESNNAEKIHLKAGETLQVSRKSKKEFLNLRAVATSDRASCLWIPLHT